MPVRTSVAAKLQLFSVCGASRRPRGGALASSSIAVLAVLGLLFPRAAAAESITLNAGGGLQSISSTVNLTTTLPDGRQIFDVVIHEDWSTNASSTLTFADFPDRSILDITKFATNGTESAWTSFRHRTATDDANVPPFGMTFESIPGGFLSYRASWSLTPAQTERCEALFPECREMFYGNVITNYRGSVSPDTTVRIRYILQLDRGSFTLTQTPNALDTAPVPEPSTLILFGSAAAAMWRARRKRQDA